MHAGSAAAQPHLPRPGDVVAGTYVLCEQIGQGGMGVVFRAEQASLARTVAVKFLHPELVHRPEIVRRFRDEAWAASRLAHPACVTIYDRGDTDDGVPFLVMEYVAGPSLSEIVAQEWPVPVTRALELVRQILAGLGEAHGAGIAHGDVKSDNVLVEVMHDGTEQAKVVDFGLARAARRADGDRTTGRAMISGTPEYMAPELVAGEEPTPASDLYAVGVILYELLTGAPPFTGASPAEILVRQLEDVVVPPSLRRPDGHVPAAIEHIVLRALAKRPGARFPDAETFAAALEAVAPPAGHEELQPCAVCGGAASIRARFCPTCGAPLSVAPARHVATDSPTLDWDADADAGRAPGATARPDDATAPAVAPRTRTRARLARGSARHLTPVTERARALRRLIGAALAEGAIGRVAEAYLELAGVLEADDRRPEAEAELEEAVDVVTGGAGAAVEHGPAPLWRLLTALALLYDDGGQRARARVAAAHAYRHAVAVDSVVGRDRVQDLLSRLA